MYSYQLVSQIDNLEKNINRDSHFFKMLNLFSSTYIELQEAYAFLSLQNDTQRIVNAKSKINNIINNNVNEIKSFINIWALFDDIKTIEIELNKFNSSTDFKIIMLEFNSYIEEFKITFNNYTKHYATDEAIKLISLSNKLYLLFNNIFSFLHDIKNILTNEYKEEENQNYTRFTLEFFTLHNFTDFSLKQYSISLIYSELCKLFGISENQYTLKIIKVESGSWFSDLLGHTIIIQLITDLIKKTLNYFYRNFIKEGKIISLPTNVEVIEGFIGLKKELDKEGIDTSEMSESIRKASCNIAKKLEILLYNEYRIKLQGEQIELREYYQEKYLEESKHFYLKENNIVDIKNDQNIIEKQ
jgi:hypothetical protein